MRTWRRRIATSNTSICRRLIIVPNIMVVIASVDNGEAAIRLTLKSSGIFTYTCAFLRSRDELYLQKSRGGKSEPSFES
jgi:hypothetical protein